MALSALLWGLVSYSHVPVFVRLMLVLALGNVVNWWVEHIEFGLDWETLRARNPRLVFVRMPAFGLTGPWRDRINAATIRLA